LYFLSPRARPEFPTFQSGLADESGELAVRLIAGDHFEFLAAHPAFTTDHRRLEALTNDLSLTRLRLETQPSKDRLVELIVRHSDKDD
ncbi:MAG: hypothetical protein AAGI17_06395, partial [Planctomycetota bacterium]